MKITISRDMGTYVAITTIIERDIHIEGCGDTLEEALCEFAADYETFAHENAEETLGMSTKKAAPHEA